MKIPKKADKATIIKCQRFSGKKLPLNANWGTCWETIAEAKGYTSDVYVHCKQNGGRTVITINNDKGTQLFQYDVSNRICLDKVGDLDWNYICMTEVKTVLRGRVRKVSEPTPKKVNKMDELNTVLEAKKERSRLRRTIRYHKAYGREIDPTKVARLEYLNKLILTKENPPSL